MSKKVVLIVSPSGNKFPVLNADEGARFLNIITNGYLDISVDELKKKLETEKDAKHTCGGWTVEVAEGEEKVAKSTYKVTKGETVETVHTAEAIAHICDCAVNTVITRLKKNAKGFTVKGWTVELVE